MKIVRCGADGEGSRAYAGVQTWLWPRSVLEGLSREMSPVSCRIGIPLCVANVKPCCVLEDRALWDNQRTTYLMIDTVTGLAPDLRNLMLVPWWFGELPSSPSRVTIFGSFKILTHLLDKYADGAVQLSCDVTPKAFQNSKRRSLSYERLNPADVQQSEDVNI